MYSNILGLFLTLTFLIPKSVQAHEQHLDPTAKAESLGTDIAPQIDGRLDDQIWSRLTPVTDFTQRDPHYGQRPSQKTEVRFCYDEANLYIGVRCFDSNPENIVKRLSYRERDMYTGDTFAIFIDSRHDHRTGVKFGTNPMGMREDSARYNDYQRDNSWDGLWWVETSIDSLGWVAEFKIPFKNFRFSSQKEQIWGLNMQRSIRHTNEQAFWKPIDRDDGSILRMSKLGHLAGIHNIQSGRRFEFVPYAANGTTKTRSLPQSNELDLGVDIKYAFTPDLTFDATINPDFAQVEADVSEINLTRFPTRFAEQRPFFVEGNSVFLTPLELYFSRRVGSKGDIIWGTKVTGKSGPMTIGLVGAQTGDWTYFGLKDSTAGKEVANFQAVRIKRDVLQNSTVGLLFGNKNFSDFHSRVFGVDASLRPGSLYFISTQAAASWNSGLAGQNRAFHLDAFRRTDGSTLGVSFRRLEANFEVNELGFLRKEQHRGTQQLAIEATYSPRPKNSAIRQIFLTGWVDGQKPLPTSEYLAMHQPRIQTGNISPDFIQGKTGYGGGSDVRVSFDGGGSLSAFASRQRRYDLIGGYFSDSLGVRLSTSSRGKITGQISGFFNDFLNFDKLYVSREYSLQFDGVLKPADNWTLEPRIRHSRTFDPQDQKDGDFWLTSLRSIYLFSPDIFIRTLIQARYEKTRVESLDTYLLSNVFAWEFRRGSRLFVAYNASRDNSTGSFKIENQALILKIAHQIDL
ncbi:MAG: hypothetical protein ACI8V2_005131 [Candidatus Latescibacterota bacterium]|jgi:hypothetical protein